MVLNTEWGTEAQRVETLVSLRAGVPDCVTLSWLEDERKLRAARGSWNLDLTVPVPSVLVDPGMLAVFTGAITGWVSDMWPGEA